MAKYERSGKTQVPQWWLDKVIPILDRTTMTNDEIARRASEYIGRASPWKGDAISKFKEGQVRTIELTNGISAALQVPPPFFTAPTEEAAIQMTLVVKQYTQDEVAQDVSERKLSTYDGVAAGEQRAARLDRKVKHG